MKALVFNGVGKIAVEERPQPQVRAPSDAVIKLTRTTICGSDLHIIQGHVPTVDKGRVIGHEGIGTVHDIGKDVKNFKVGDRVLISCITSCAACAFCRKGTQGLCNDVGGWRLGHLDDGTQAEFVRIPFADASLYKVPRGIDERSLLVLSDILPTGLEVGVLRGGVKPGSSIAIIGAGPVGLSALLAAQLYSPSTILMIDRDDGRLAVSKRMGATHTLNPTNHPTSNGNASVSVKDIILAQKLGVDEGIDGFDVVIEAVGVPATFELCQDLVGKGGAIANVGVHGAKVDLHMEKLWGRGIQVTMALVNTSTLPMLMKLFEAGKLRTEEMITHDFKFADILKAYDTFGRAAETGALKVNIEF